jgi:hypothetical protein
MVNFNHYEVQDLAEIGDQTSDLRDVPNSENVEAHMLGCKAPPNPLVITHNSGRDALMH